MTYTHSEHENENGNEIKCEIVSQMKPILLDIEQLIEVLYSMIEMKMPAEEEKMGTTLSTDDCKSIRTDEKPRKKS